MNLDHIAINVKDINESVEWYISNLGAQVDYSDQTWAMLSVGPTKIALTVSEQHPPHIAFSVENLCDLPGDASYHRDGSAYVYSEDPDGNTVEHIYWPEKTWSDI